MALINEDVVSFSFNQSDTGVLIALAIFVVLGLLFGAKKTAARLVLDVLACFGSILIANIVLPYLQPMAWYQNVITTLGNNATLVNWIANILLIVISGAVLFAILKLIVFHLIDDTNKDAPVVSRLLGVLFGVCDWLILLLAASFLFAALPKWLGSNTPDWITQANDYLSSSLIVGKLMAMYTKVITSLGIAA